MAPPGRDVTTRRAKPVAGRIRPRTRATKATTAADGVLDGASADAADATVSDALTIPDVLEAAPAHCATSSFECVPPIPQGWSGPFEVYHGTNPPASCSTNFVASYSGAAGRRRGTRHVRLLVRDRDGRPMLARDRQPLREQRRGRRGVHDARALHQRVALGGPVRRGRERARPVFQPRSAARFSRWAAPRPTAGAAPRSPPPPCPRSSGPAPRVPASRRWRSPRSTAPPAPSALRSPRSRTRTPSLCIAQVGDVPCPADRLHEPLGLVRRDTKDLRRCTDCTCGPVTNSSCTGYVDMTTPSSSGPCTGTSYTQLQPPADVRR